jgi:hypothetical protein
LILNILTILSQLKEIIPHIAIPVFKAIMELPPLGCFNYMSKKAEIISESKESIFVNFYPALGKQI